MLQGAWWLWATILVTRFHRTRDSFDWTSPGFGSAFAVFLILTLGFQVNYLFLYFIIHNLSRDEAEVIRYAALLRGTESAWQALSYGLTSLPVFGEVGGVYMNFGLWAVAVFPAWLVVKHFGAQKDQTELDVQGSTEVSVVKDGGQGDSGSGELEGKKRDEL